MSGQDLSGYVREQLKRGYTEDQVRQYLMGYGYSKEQVDAAFGSKSAPDSQLTQYVKQNLAAGYQADAIRNYLLQYNYPPEAVDSAIKSAQLHVRHTVDLSGRSIMVIFAAVFLIGAMGAGFYFLTSSDPEQLLDFELKLTEYELQPDDELHFTNTFINMGTERKYDIYLEYEVVNLASQETLATKKETIGIQTVMTPARSIHIPSDAPAGRYILQGIAEYGNMAAESHETFTVIRPQEQPTCSDGIKNQDEEDIDCGGVCPECTEIENCYDSKKNQDEEGVDCGGVCEPCEETCYDGKKNQGEEGVDCGGPCPPCDAVQPDNKELLSKVKSLGKINEDESVRLCSAMDSERYSDDCYLFLAKTFNTTLYCEDIDGVTQIDNCYMHFMLLGDYSICEKIQNQWLRSSCLQTKSSSEIYDKYSTQSEE